MTRLTLVDDPEEQQIFFEELHFDMTSSADCLTKSVVCVAPDEISYEQFIWCLESWIQDVKSGRIDPFNTSKGPKH